MKKKGKMKAISTIARESGVSVATVSRVLNNDRGVSNEIRRKTLEVIERSGYRPRSNIKRGTRVGVVIQSQAPIFDAFYSQLITGISTYLSDQGIDTTLVLHAGRSQKGGVPLAELLQRKRCNGAVLLTTIEEDADELIESRIPVMLAANRTDRPELGFVDCDCYEGALEVTDYLLRLGHQKIGFLSGSLAGNSDHQQRLRAYRDALSAVGIAPNDSWVIPHAPTEVTEQAGYNQARKLLAEHPEVTAIFANNDLMAYGAIWACVEAGRSVPQDVSIVGYDDCSTSRFSNPPLTTVRQHLREMGYEAARAVDEKLRGIIDILPRKVLDTELIVRRSCAPAPNP